MFKTVVKCVVTRQRLSVIKVDVAYMGIHVRIEAFKRKASLSYTVQWLWLISNIKQFYRIVGKFGGGKVWRIDSF